MESTLNAYLTVDLFDESEKIYSISEEMENINIVEEGYRINKISIAGLAIDQEILFSDIGIGNFLVMRADDDLSVKLNSNVSTAMTISKSFPTILNIAGIQKIYVSNVSEVDVDLHIFIAKLDL